VQSARQRLRALGALRPPHAPELDLLTAQLQHLFLQYNQKFVALVISIIVTI
jgi:hypothetical protein